MSDPAVAVVPRPAATLMLLRDRPRLEVLLLRRSSATPFVPGAHVFPGGAVEASDHDHGPVVAGLEPAVADQVVGVAGATGFWVAAVREALEEAGVLLARDRGGRAIGGDHPALTDLEALRRSIETGDRLLRDVCTEHGLSLPLDRVAYVANWITPEPSPRRYDTRFFAAAMPEGQEVRSDGWEAVEANWWEPAAALADWQAGTIELITPTVASLRLLAGFATSADALAALSAGAARAERVLEIEGGLRVPLPHEQVGEPA